MRYKVEEFTEEDAEEISELTKIVWPKALEYPEEWRRKRILTREQVVEEMRRSVEESLPPQIREKIREALCVLSGVVVDVVEEKPVQGAEVILTDKTTYRVHTDSNGRFTIANIEPGRYKLIIRAKNYVTWVREVELRSGDYLELTIAMEPLKPRVRDVIATATITATPLLLAFISALAKKW